METNKKQTAVSWLKDQVIDNKDIYIEGNTLMIPNDIFRKAQQMEREQIEISFTDGFSGSGEGYNAEYPFEDHPNLKDFYPDAEEDIPNDLFYVKGTKSPDDSLCECKSCT